MTKLVKTPKYNKKKHEEIEGYLKKKRNTDGVRGIPYVEEVIDMFNLDNNGFLEWQRNYPKFVEIIERILNLQKLRIKQLGFSKDSNANFCKYLLGATHGESETIKKEVNINQNTTSETISEIAKIWDSINK